jgi:indolepyruvate ferredoxin oxidoreductase beta subunit
MTQEKQTINFVLTGVGGQGTLFASNIIAETGWTLGYDVKKAEIHGLSQRGGSVVSNVRWGAQVFSPIVPIGYGDVMIAFEKLEALRSLNLIRPGGLVIVNDYSIVPVAVSAGSDIYPNDEKIQSGLQKVTQNIHWIKGMQIAENLGSPQTVNVVLLGALSVWMETQPDPWLSAIQKLAKPKFQEINLKAFEEGRKNAKSQNIT